MAGLNDVTILVNRLLNVKGIQKGSYRNPDSGKCHITPRADATAKPEAGKPGIAHRFVDLPVFGKETLRLEGERIWVDTLVVEYCPTEPLIWVV